MNDTLTSLICGTPHFETPVAPAVAARFEKIRAGLVESDDGCYDGSRTQPENLGWRLVQRIGDVSIEEIERGDLDAEIIETWREAARAEHWYRYEKDWGWDD